MVNAYGSYEWINHIISTLGDDLLGVEIYDRRQGEMSVSPPYCITFLIPMGAPARYLTHDSVFLDDRRLKLDVFIRGNNRSVIAIRFGFWLKDFEAILKEDEIFELLEPLGFTLKPGLAWKYPGRYHQRLYKDT